MHLQARASNFKDFCVFNQCKWSSGFPPHAQEARHTREPGRPDCRGRPGPGNWLACRGPRLWEGTGLGHRQLPTDLAGGVGGGCPRVGRLGAVRLRLPWNPAACPPTRLAVALPGCRPRA